MKTKEKINNIIRLFTKPKKWTAMGNMEFGELTSLCTDHPSIGAEEVRIRHIFWYAEYSAVKRIQVVMIGILSEFFASLILLYSLHSMIAFYIIASMFFAVTTGLILAMQRNEILWENIVCVYGWLMDNIIDPTPIEIEPEIMLAFERFCEKEREKEAIEQKKFKRFLGRFGYNLITIEN